MSQWNNSYAYNNQYQSTNSWNGDVNAQYMSQAPIQYQQFQSAPTPFDPGAQYVSFNEFLSQMQGNSAGTSTAAGYNNVQYQNYTGNQQFNYQSIPSSSQNADTYNYAPNAVSTNANELNTYQAQNQYNAPPDENLINDVVFKSNLTATATEFVPKSNIKPSTSHQNIKNDYSKARNGVKEAKGSYGSSSDSNWRERPSSSSQNGAVSDNKHNDNKSDVRQDYNRESSNRNDSNYRDSNSRNYERDTNTRNYDRDSNNRNYDRDSSSRNYERDSNGRNYEKNSNIRNYERDPNSRNYERDSNNRNYESSRSDNRYESRNYDNHFNDRGQKNNSKSKSKEFFNSSINKSNHDVRKDGSRPRHFPGSSRLRAVGHSSTEDEQYANTYLQYKDEKSEKPPENKEKEYFTSPKNKPKHSTVEEKKMTQRERLTEQLNKGTLECLVCCDRVRPTDKVWSCTNCYHVLHLRCVKKWATSSLVEGKWRCPACQNTSTEVPSEYWCLCGAVRSPERAHSGAHSCGRACARPRACPHPCPYTCHPGPCPPCRAQVVKQCGCGADSRSVLCSNKAPLLCGRICGRVLACGAHNCPKECHEGACGDCTETITQVCYCEQVKQRTVACTSSTTKETHWTCGAQCTYVLSCGAHSCGAKCHPPPCAPCALRPDNVNTCPCGHTKLKAGAREKCTDPIPLCDNICAKPLECGPAGDKHFCKLDCHHGECPPCPEKTVLQCRCGHSSREVPCTELPQMLNNIFCQKKCNKKLSCGRHRCRLVCCAEQSHRCGVVCGRALSCQLHRCEEFCHTGHCAPCPRLGFSELSCECGASVLLPPIRCGARRPACSAPCRRPRACGHEPHHTCHEGDCPPCVVLTAKMCHGGHEERKTIPCSLEEFSCGLPCGKPLPCGKHTCIKTCHKGPCDTGKCNQPCEEKRPSCGHPCSAPCHSDGNSTVCPSTAPCKRPVMATCHCGRRKAERTCADNARDRARIMSALAATKMQEGGTVEVTERPGSMLKTLECDEECRSEARARQLALALQIRNPDVSSKLAPRYSDGLRATAVKEPAFAQLIHDKLTELVQLAKKSKQKTRSHSFPSMNWQKRQFIHELCEHFGCESVAYDAEPNRNVVATADKEKSWLPAMSILEVVAREAGKRRVPGPVLRATPNANANASANANATLANKSSTGWATLTSTNAWAARSQSRTHADTPTTPAPAPAPAPKIDYFDNPPDN